MSEEKLSEKTVKIVILGSLRDCDYEVTVPRKIENGDNVYGLTHDEKAEMATKRMYPAITYADLIIVFGNPGKHTQRDIDYAVSQNKKIIYLNNIEFLETENQRLKSKVNKK